MAEKSKNGHISARQRLDRSARNIALQYIFTVRTTPRLPEGVYGAEIDADLLSLL